MEIKFKDKKLQTLCEKKHLAIQKLGEIAAKKLRTRLDDLGAASNVAELISGRPHPLSGDKQGQFALDLARGCRLVFEPANDPVPRRKDASIVWSAVTIVRIEYIGDYHD